MIDISLIPKKDGSSTVSANKVLALISLVVLILSIAAGGVVIFMLMFSQKNITQLNQQLVDLDQQVNSQQNTIQFAQSVLVADEIMGQHRYPSKFLDILEKNTNVFIQWTDLNFSSFGRNIELSGTAHDLLAIAQQIKKLENSKNVSNVKLGSVSTANNKVSFRLSFSLNDSVLAY